MAMLFFGSLAACAQGTPQSYRNIHFDYNTQRSGGDYTHFQTNNFESCAEACFNDSRCRAMDFNITNNSCRLKDRVPSPRPSRIIASGVKQGDYNSGGDDPYPPGGYYPNPPNRPDDVGGMEITRNMKRNGGDYTNFTVGSMKECARACGRDNNCQSFNYGKQRKDCWLKNTIPAGVRNNTVISGIKRGENNDGYFPNPPGGYYPDRPNRPDNVDGMEITRNIKRNGGDYTNFTVRNMKECARACSRDNNCRSFNYGKQKRDCWLKNNIPSGVPNNTVISGIKRW